MALVTLASVRGHSSGTSDDADDGWPHPRDPGGGNPPPAEDRIWRHPSELGPQPSSRHDPAARLRKRLIRLVTISAVVVLGVATAIAVSQRGAPTPDGRSDARPVGGVDGSLALQVEPVTGPGDSLGPVVDTVSPWVVEIEVYSDNRAVASASGVILRPDGLVVTASHLVASGDQIRAVTSDGRSHEATILGVDHWTDIAVVLITASRTPFAVAQLGTASDLQPGDPAIVIGSPHRNRSRAAGSFGPIASRDRWGLSPSGHMLYGLLETGAPLDAGNIGGAVVDREGALVGITTMINEQDPTSTFATPIEIAHTAATDIVTWGVARHGHLGVRCSDATAEDLHGSGRAEGVTVTAVEANGPAASSGIQPGDVILDLDQASLRSMSDLVNGVRFARPGRSVTMTLWRDGTITSVEAILGELPAVSPVATEPAPSR